VSAVSHYLEQEGIASASISLVREHSEAMRPPRALWVPFMLGRPLGVPHDPEFQRSVLRALLALFDEPQGPVLRDYPHDAPRATVGEGEEEEAEDACPVNFARVRRDGEHALAGALAEEIDQLQPWHDIARRQRGTMARLSGLSPEAAGSFIASFLGPGEPVNYRPSQEMGQSLKYASDDLRTYYEEAALAQPGELSPQAIKRWFYKQTVAGEVLLKVRAHALQSTDASVKLMAGTAIVPRDML